MVVAALNEQAEGDDSVHDDAIEVDEADDEVDDQADLDDEELQQMLQDNESSEGAITDTAGTDWCAPCTTTKHSMPKPEATVFSYLTSWRRCTRYAVSCGIALICLHTYALIYFAHPAHR